MSGREHVVRPSLHERCETPTDLLAAVDQDPHNLALLLVFEAQLDHTGECLGIVLRPAPCGQGV